MRQERQLVYLRRQIVHADKKGMQGPEVQIWFKPLVGCKDLLDRVIHEVDILERDDNLTLEQLVAMHPCPPRKMVA